jgi:hypothetical protein
VASRETLEILLKIRAETDKAIKQMHSDMKSVGDSVKKFAEETRKSTQEAARGRDELGRFAKGAAQAREALDQTAKATARGRDEFGRFTRGAGEAGKALGGFSLGGKAFAFNEISEAAGRIFGVVKQIVGAFAELAQRGTQVAQVSGSFNVLAGSAANANAILLKGREASRGLISDFDLMVAANKMMNLGLPTTAQGFAMLTEGARKLGAAVGRDAADSMNRLIEGLGKGSAEMLDELGLVVRAEDSYKKYAAAIGTTAEKLTAKQRQLAVYEEGLRQVQEKVSRLTETELTFAERTQQVAVGVKNFSDAMGLAIAQSPVLNAGMGYVAEAMQRAFGANQQQTVQALIGQVNDFAIFLVNVAKVGVEVGAFISNAFNGVKVVVAGLVAVMAGQVSATIGLLQQLADQGAKIPGPLGDAFKAAATGLGSLADQAALVKAQQADYVKSLLDTIAGTEQAKSKSLDWLNGMQSRMESARGAIVKVAEGIKATGPAATAAASEASKAFESFNKKLKEVSELLALAAKNDAMESFLKQYGDDVRKIAEQAKILGVTLPKAFIDAKNAAEQDEMFKALNAHYDKLDKTVLESAAKRKEAEADLAKAINEEAEKGNKALIESHNKTVEEIRKAKVQLFNDLSDAAGMAADLLTSMGVSGANAFVQILGGFAAGAAAAANFAAATTVAQKAMAGLQAAQAAYSSGSALGGAAAGAAAGSALGPWGALAGGALGALAGIFGGAKKAAEELRRMREELNKVKDSIAASFGSMEGFRRAAVAMGVDVSKAMKTSDPKVLQNAIERVNKAMEEQKKRIEGVRSAMEGFALRMKGFAEQIDRGGLSAGEQAKRLAQYEKKLKDAGVAEDELKRLVKERAAQLDRAGVATDAAQAGFDRMGRFALATFGAMVRETGNVIGAIREMAPSLDQLIELQQQFGFEASGATARMLAIRGVIAANEDVAASIEGLNQMMLGLGDAGAVTFDLFQDFATDAGSIFNEMIGRGIDSNTAMALMQPTLQQLWEMQKRFGLATDETTAALLQQAEEQGLVGEAQMSVNEQILEVLLAIGEALDANVSHVRNFGRAGQEAFDGIANSANNAANATNGVYTGGHHPSANTGVNPGEVPEFESGGPTGGYEGLAYVHRGEFMLDRDRLASVERALASAAALARSGGGGFSVSLQLGQRQLGQASGTLSRRRISRTSPAGIRR